MRTRRIVYLVLGIFFTGVQLLAYLEAFAPDNSGLEKSNGDIAYQTGYFIGKNLFLFAAILCWIGVYRVGRKIAKKKRQELLRSFDDPS